MAEHKLRVIFQQSLANRPDAGVVEKLVAGYPGLTVLRQTRVMSGGYSGARVYLAVAELRGTPPAHWILKVGDAADLGAESKAYDVCKASPAGTIAVPRIHFAETDGTALLIYDFAGLNGEPPLDLHDGLREYEAHEMVGAAVDNVSQWLSQPEWKSDHITNKVRDWTAPRIAQLPVELAALNDAKTLYFPDVGHALSNPGYYISRRMLPRVEARVPFAFTHGDLNLRNVLFATNQRKQPDPTKLRIIDFRHAGTEQWAIIDLAKLEACIRHQYLDDPSTHGELAQHVAFIDASTSSLRLDRPPELLSGNSLLQDLWRHLSRVRIAAAQVLPDENAQKAYWAALMSYAISYASYENRTLYGRRLAYLDAACVFTRHFQQPDLKSGQTAVPLQSGLSAEIEAVLQPTSWTAATLVSRLISRGEAVLVVGHRFGRVAGAEPFAAFLQNLHKDLGKIPPPTSSTKLLFGSLGRAASRDAVAAAIRKRVGRWSDPEELAQLQTSQWALVVYLHCGSFVRRGLTAGRGDAVIVDDEDQLPAAAANLTDSATIYLPFYGDSDSGSRTYPLSPRELEARLGLVSRAVEIIKRRLRPLCIVFWRCEDVDPELLVDLRLQMGDGDGLEAFYVTDEESPEREGALSSVGIIPIRARLEELSRLGPEPKPAGHVPPTESVWRRGETVYRLPNVERQTAGLLGLFREVHAVGAFRAAQTSFLLGAPPTASDIEDGRVLKRHLVEAELVPAIQGGMVRSRDRIRWVFVEGRPGAGVSTCLCLAAHYLSIREIAPVFVFTRTEGSDLDQWRTAGELLGEVSKQVDRPVVVFLDSTDVDARLLDRGLAAGMLTRRGELIVVVGGRVESMLKLKRDLDLAGTASVTVPDTLSDQEWSALAGIVRGEGFSSQISQSELTERMRRVGLLLPAIYEGTDRQNRKFKEIVAYEYHRYSRDQLVQRAYRLVCLAGAYGVSLTQYWLLKAVGGASVAHATTILGALSRDIVVERPMGAGTPEGDLTIGPRHRLIADAVLDIAVPDPEHRLADARSLIASANLGSRSEGSAVARLLSRKNAFREWLVNEFGYERADLEAIELFETLLDRGDIHPFVEVTLRHHFALTLRTKHDHDGALEQAKKAYDLDRENPASAHVLGLVHEAKALAGWRSAFISRDPEGFARALVEEQEATSFFGQSRAQQPAEEYGYESEARYLRRKQEIFSDSRNLGRVPPELEAQGATAIARGLRLVHEAEIRVPPGSLIETRHTKARLLAQVGDFDAAWSLLQEMISDARDSVARNELRELAATIAAMHQRWDDVRQEASCLVENGVRSPYVYLLLDDALAALGHDAERQTRMRESAEEWNREDLETLVRWGGICAQGANWERAATVLHRAERAAQRLGLSTTEQFRRRGAVRSSDGTVARFVGEIARLFRPYEGLIQPAGTSASVGVYFRDGEDSSRAREIGDRVEFSVTWRIRGLRAEDLTAVVKTSA